MRRMLISAFVVTVLLGSSITPAHAAFGLSKCEKVKKEILALEKTETPKVQSWNKNWGGKDAIKLLSFQKQSNQEWLYIVNLEVKMYSLERNNPKCFTITQNLYIARLLPLWQESKQHIENGEPPPVIGFGSFTYLKSDSIYNQ